VLNANVGIGTTNPEVKLEVIGANPGIQANIRTHGDIHAGYGAATGGGLYFGSGGYSWATGDYIRQTATGRIEIIAGGTKYGPQLVVNNGSVGIGTNGPISKLSNAANLASDGTKRTGPSSINWRVEDYGGYAIGIENTATGGSGLLVDAGNNSGTGATVAHFVSNNASLMYIGENGNIGINNTTPARKLHINDVMRLEPRTSAPGSPSEGDLYVNSTDHHIYCYLGGVWKQLD